MDRDVAAPSTGGQAYQRAAVDEFLAAADREQRRLRGLIDDAHARRAAAQQVAQRATAMTEQARSALQDLQRELSQQRREVEAEAARIVREGQDEAASRLLKARDEARALLIAHDVVLDAPDDVELDLIALERAERAAELEPVEPVPVGAPLKMMSFEEAILLSSEDDLSGNGFSGNGSNGNGFSGNGFSGNGASGNGANGNGASGNGYLGNGSSAQHIDAPRSSGLSGLLRRTRGRPPVEQTEAEPDEFLEFLRGALLDDTPLGPIDDHPEL